MAQLTQLHLAHLPSEITIYAVLFTSLNNAPFLRQQLLDGNTDFEYAFLDAKSILSTTHILAAVFRAVNDAQNHRLKSRNVHSEIVFSLSPNNNIATSFRTFGITDTTTSLIAIKVLMPSSSSSSPSSSSSAPQLTQSSIQKHLTTHVSGDALPFTDANLMAQTDLQAVRKAYKLNNVSQASGGGGKKTKSNVSVNGALSSGGEDAAADAVRERREVEVAVLGMMALKGS